MANIFDPKPSSAGTSSRGSSGNIFDSGSTAVAKPKSGGDGFFGSIGHFFSQGGKDIVSVAQHAPGGVLHVGKLVGEGTAAFVTGDEAAQKKNAADITALGKGTVQQIATDLRHPLRRPGYTLLDVLPFVNVAGKVAEAGRIAATGEGATAAAKSLVTRATPAPRIISHDGQTVKIPASAAPANRLFQHGLDSLRQKFPNVPVLGAAHVVGKETARTLRYQGEVAKAPINALVAEARSAGMFKRGPNGRVTNDALARQHALRVVAEQVPIPERASFHQSLLDEGYKASALKNPEIAAMKAQDFAAGHAEQLKLNALANQYVTHDGGVPRLADPVLQKTYDQMLKVAGGREQLLSELDKLDAATASGRLSAAGRVLKGAKWVPETQSRLGQETPALRAAIAQRDRIAKEQERILVKEEKYHADFAAYKEAERLKPENKLDYLKSPKGRPAPSNPYRDNLVKLGIRLEAAQAKVDQMVAAAGRRVAPTGLVGAEDFTGGEARIPTVPKGKQAKSPNAAPGRSGGIGAVPEPPSVRHPYTGAAYRGGAVRTDVVRLMAESALEAQKHWTLLHLGETLKAVAKDAPTSKHDIPIVVDKLPDQPSLAAIRQRMEEAPVDNKIVGALSHTYEAVRQHIFPAYEKAADGYTQPIQNIPGVKYVDSRLLGGLDKPNPLLSWNSHGVLRGTLAVADGLNNASKIAILYLKPAYAVPNLMGNVALNIAQQGFAYPGNLKAAARLWAGADKETAQAVLASMGEGIGASLDSHAGLLAGASHKLSGKWGAVVDTLPRLSAFLHEAKRDGVRTPEQLRQLFKDPANADRLDQITRRANQEIIDYGNLSPVEQAIIRRVIFFYPWVKGSTVWSVHFLSEHPVQAGVVGQAGQLGEKDQAAGLGTQLPSWAGPLVPTGGKGPHGLPNTISFAGVSALETPAEILAAARGVAAGHPSAAYNLAGMLTPGVNAGVELFSKGAATAGKDLVNNLPPTVLAQQLLGSHLPAWAQRKPSKTYPYQNQGLAPLWRWLLSTGLVPRETDPGALARSYGYEHRKGH